MADGVDVDVDVDGRLIGVEVGFSLCPRLKLMRPHDAKPD